MPAKMRSIASNVSVLIFTTILLFAVLVLAAGLTMNDRIKEARDSLGLEMHDQELVESLYIDSQTVVSDLRAYLAFGRADFLTQFIERRRTFEVKLNEVSHRFQARDYGETFSAEWDAILKAWASYSGMSEAVIELKKIGNMEEIENLSKSTTTSNVAEMDRMFRAILSAQDDAVLRWLEDNRKRAGMLILLPILVVTGAALAGGLLVVYLRRKVIGPIVMADAAVNRIAEGEYAHISLGHRDDELRRLAHGINYMSGELRRRHVALEESNKELIHQRDLLEAQNEEISAQQIEQEEMLRKLTERERELELITTYQEKLTGHVEMKAFLHHSIRALLQALHQDAAVLVAENAESLAFDVIYSYGYPQGAIPSSYRGLFGPGSRVLCEKQAIVRQRRLSADERGLHGGYDFALDQYFPLLDESSRVIGVLLLTSYGTDATSETLNRLAQGLVRQFALAYLAQTTNEKRRKQAHLLEELNEALSQERDGLQQQRDLVRRIIESIHEGMVMCDGGGRLLFSNKQMNEMFGFDWLPGSDIRELVRRLEAASAAQGVLGEKVEALLDGKLEQLQERFAFALGESGETHYELYVNAIPDTGDYSRSLLFVFRDRSHEEKADEVKNEFISIVSHELRTPLASVLGFMELLLNRDIAKEKQKKYMETIYKEAKRLSNLINDFLDLQRMESGKQTYRIVPVSLSDIAREAAEQWNGKQEHRVETDIEPNVLVSADVDRLMQMMHNLLSNAVKYSPNADKVVVRVGTDERGALVEVQDFGLGIPEEAKQKLFTKFYRVDNSDRRQIGGTGLGLSIVKEIVDSHHGEISFESELGRGSTFRVRLKTYRSTEIGGKAVILEDDDNLSKLIAVAFEKLKVPTVRLRSAEDAVLSLRETDGAPPLLCIVDIQLSGKLSGWEFIAELLRHPVYRATPVIVSTVLEQPEHFRETKTGKFLRKPFTIERLLELASSLMGTAPDSPTVVFPVQDETTIAARLEEKGIRVAEVKVKRDIIEVEVKKHE